MTIAAFVLGCVVAFGAGWLLRDLLATLPRGRRGGDVDLVGARPREGGRYFNRYWDLRDLPRIESEVRRDGAALREPGRVVPLEPFRMARGDDA